MKIVVGKVNPKTGNVCEIEMTTDVGNRKGLEIFLSLLFAKTNGYEWQDYKMSDFDKEGLARSKSFRRRKGWKISSQVGWKPNVYQWVNQLLTWSKDERTTANDYLSWIKWFPGKAFQLKGSDGLKLTKEAA